MGFLKNTARLAVMVLFALVFSQLPGFMSHYQQRLGGNYDNQALVVAGWENVAKTAGMTKIEDYCTFIESFNNQKLSLSAKEIRQTTQRFETLQAAYYGLKKASIWSRPFIFFATLEVVTAREVWNDYVPNLPMNTEGWVYVAIGAVVGFILFSLVIGAFRRVAKVVRRSRPAGPPATATP